MKTPDTGPDIRPPSNAVRVRARAAVMSQVQDGDGAMSDDGADLATFDRSGFEDAPREIKKRWIGLGAGLVAAAVGAAIVIGPGLRGEDVGLDPSAPTDTAQNPAVPDSSSGVVAQDCLDQANLQIRLEDETNRSDGEAGDYTTARAAGPLSIVTSHVESTYEFAVVANSAFEVTCIGDATNGVTGSSSGLTAPSSPDLAEANSFMQLADGVTEVASGQVADDVTKLSIASEDGTVRVAHVADGYYSAVVDNESETVYTYLVTRDDGTEESVYDYAMEEPQMMPGQFAELCTLGANDASLFDDWDANAADVVASLATNPMTLVTHHITDSYQFAVLSNGDWQTSCVGDEATFINTDDTVANEKPDALRFTSRRALRIGGPVVEVGQVADDIEGVTVNTPDGPVVALVEDGYYSVIEGEVYGDDQVTYRVTRDDRSTETVTSP